MYQIAHSIGWAITFMIVGGIGGIGLVVAASMLLPKLLNHITPHIDEEKEIVRGNVAVAQYFGRVVAASIIGTSIVIAAAVLGGILAACL